MCTKFNIIHTMRTNVEIDDELMESAMRAGHFKTKKDAVEAGLALLTRQAAYREILKWEGKLHWEGDDEAGVGAYRTMNVTTPLAAREPAAPLTAKKRHGRR
jgi:antitoxin ParD1/3/4